MLTFIYNDNGKAKEIQKILVFDASIIILDEDHQIINWNHINNKIFFCSEIAIKTIALSSMGGYLFEMLFRDIIFISK